MLEVKNLKFYRGDKEFAYSFSLNKNSWLSVVGPSGSGKTTLLELLVGFLTPEFGSIYLNKISLENIPPGRRKISYIFQANGVFEHLKVQKNLQLALHDSGDDSKTKDEKILQVLDLVKLDQKYLSRLPSELSGGEKSRLQIARALLRPCELLLMDEPFSALDSELRHDLLKLVHTLRTQFSFMVIFVTHNKQDAKFNHSEILEMANGQIVTLNGDSDRIQ